MVLVKRRSTSSNPNTSTSLAKTKTNPRLAKVNIAYGNGSYSIIENGEPPSSPESLSPHIRKFSFTNKKKKGFIEIFPSWAYKAIVIVVVLMIITRSMISWNSSQNYRKAENMERNRKVLFDDVVTEVSNSEKSRQAMQANLDDLMHARQKYNENRKSEGMQNNGGEVSPDEPVNGWLNRELIQEKNRQEALKSFGAGPHIVKFTVEFPEDNSTGTFNVKLAPLVLMPYAVNTFLKQVSQRLWDRTVFWHHDGIDHVMQAAGIHYKTGETKHHYFDALDVGALNFGEYSADFPHKRYTIGYAGRGPEFYINARDNTRVHGPGGQQHHDSSDEADPCFGKIISGFDTVNRMNDIQAKQSKVAAERREWHDNELTHILKVEILK